MSTALDFSVLDVLTEKRPATSPQYALKEDERYRTIDEPQNSVKAHSDAPQGISSKLAAQEREKEQQREAAARQMEVYRAHQDAIRRGGMLMCEITKGINAGADPLELLLKACEVIGNMTGDGVFCEQNRQTVIAVYGAGLLEPAPLQMELDEVRRRLAMLTRPELDAEPEDSRQRIRAAIKAHEERAATLEAMIATDPDCHADSPQDGTTNTEKEGAAWGARAKHG